MNAHADRIRRAARACGYATDADVCRAAGLHADYLIDLNQDPGRRPTLRAARKLSRATGLSVAAILRQPDPYDPCDTSYSPS